MCEVRLLQSEQNSVLVGFNGKISADNAETIGENLIRIRKENPQSNLVLDFGELEYISSAGLRMLLKVLKAESGKVVKILNVSSGVYDILEMTGFDQIYEVHKAMRKFSLEGFELIGQGANGEVYRIDNENIIKLFQKDTPLEVIDRERILARQALISGIPTAISYDVVQVEDRYGIMFELIAADTLSSTLTSRPAEYDEYISQYIQLYQKIHSIKGDSGKFMNIKDIYHGAIDYCNNWYTKEELNKLRELVDSVPETGTLIHGDFHPNNIMVQDGELILIDMGDMSLGHPIFDWLATAATQVNLVQLSPEYAEFHTKMPAELITKTWRKLFDNYFIKKSLDERQRIENQICLFSKLKVALSPYFGRGAGDEIIKASVDDAKMNFMPKIDSLIGSVDW